MKSDPVRGYQEKILQHMMTIPASGSSSNHFCPLSRNWPYQAKVINTLDTINNPIVHNPFIQAFILTFFRPGYKAGTTFAN